ncbi:MAG: hypothetical protein AB1597_01305 [Chloroflexota bacterium]
MLSTLNHSTSQPFQGNCHFSGTARELAEITEPSAELSVISGRIMSITLTGISIVWFASP